MKPILKQYEYFRMKMVKSEFLLQFDSLKEMNRFAEKNGLKSIYVFSEEKDAPERFAFSNKGGLLEHPTQGYQTLEDFKNADFNGFPDATSFYAARKLEFERYDEYKMSSESGITDAKDYEEIKKGGYIEAFKELNQGRMNNPEMPQLEEVTNAFELQKWIAKKKFENAAEFMSAWKGGFTEAPEFREATNKEFKNYKDYKTGGAHGFSFGLDYYKALEVGIEEFAEFQKYLDIELLQFANTSSDQKLLCVILSQLGDGKKLSVNRIIENLAIEKKNYLRKDGTMPPWFKTELNTPEDIGKFVASNDTILKYGYYEPDGEFFQKKKISDRVIILDGSNVAFGKTGEPGAKPYMKNILTMVKFLKSKGISEINVFTDISIKRRIPDIELLPEVQKLCNFSYTPAAQAADLFLLSYVKQHHCLLVSNDLFRDWKKRDPWVAHNIDFYIINFHIDGDILTVPDFDTK